MRWTGFRVLLLGPVLGLVVAGCAMGAAPSREGAQPGLTNADEIRALEQELAEHEAQLTGTLRAEAAPDCQRARALSGAICQLGERICRIAERHPQQSDLTGRCQDATRRCEQGRVKVAIRCPAGP